jgi:hypothetical protein
MEIEVEEKGVVAQTKAILNNLSPKKRKQIRSRQFEMPGRLENFAALRPPDPRWGLFFVQTQTLPFGG